MQAPRAPGAGGETRSYYFLKTLAEESDLTLISLGGFEGTGRVQADLKAICKDVIEPLLLGEPPPLRHEDVSRFSKWAGTLGVLLFPWRNHWEQFLRYFLQFALPKNVQPAQHREKRVLTFWLRNIYRIAARVSKIPPTTTFMFNRAFEE